MRAMASLIPDFLLNRSGADQRKHQSSASLAFVGGMHRWPVGSPHEGPVTREKFPFDDAMNNIISIIVMKKNKVWRLCWLQLRLHE